MLLADLDTPSLILDSAKLERNAARLNAKLGGQSVALRPHVKTAKSIDVLRRIPPGVDSPITVSTLREAEYFFGHGVRDILYAVGVAPAKLDQVAGLRKRGAEVTVVVDSLAAATAVAQRGAELGHSFPVLIEIDSDGHRAGVKPGAAALVDIGRVLANSPGSELRGVMTHAGDSYNCSDVAAIAAVAEQERSATAACAAALRGAGLPCPVVSVGSTPTALFGASFEGVTEVRAGVYMFMDLVMAGLGVCAVDDIALSVLATVIGHQHDKGWIITDAGWMALSRDRGTAKQRVDQGYGLVCDAAGAPIGASAGAAPGALIVSDANQEHGIVALREPGRLDLARFPVGSQLRILPNHACATAAQHSRYRVVAGGTEVHESWDRIGGW